MSEIEGAVNSVTVVIENGVAEGKRTDWVEDLEPGDEEEA
jgi:hypothetical protein